jgi:hypothetical protein
MGGKPSLPVETTTISTPTVETTHTQQVETTPQVEEEKKPFKFESLKLGFGR